MKKFVGIAVSLALCAISGAAIAKNAEGTDNNVAIGPAQTGSVVSAVVLSQPIEGQFSSTVTVGVGSSASRSITGGMGGSITGGRGGSITGGRGGSITGGMGGSITGGRGGG